MFLIYLKTNITVRDSELTRPPSKVVEGSKCADVLELDGKHIFSAGSSITVHVLM